MNRGFYILFGFMVTLLLAWKTTDNLLRFGDGANTTKTFEADIGTGSLNPKIKFDATTGKWQFTNDGVNTRDIGSGSGTGSGINLLDNPGCENGSSTPDDWTASGGTLTRTTTAGEVGFDQAACKWDASALAQTLSVSDVAVPNILESQVCQALITYLADTIVAGDYLLRAELDDGTDLSANLSLTPTAGAWRKAYVAFTCPNNDNIKLTIEAGVANPAVILIDNTHLGSSTNEFLSYDPAEGVAEAYFTSTAGCQWNRGSNPVGAFATTAACPAITVASSSPSVTINTADTDLPQIVFSSLPAGQYEVTAFATVTNTVAGDVNTLAINDGTVTRGNVAAEKGTTGASLPMVVTGLFTHAGGAKTFALHGNVTSGTIRLENDDLGGATQGEVTRFVVKRLNSSTATPKITLETQDWLLDANIGGSANFELSLTSVATYAEIIDANQDLVINPVGPSGSPQIPCSTTNPPTGLTCAAGSESLGISFIPPYTGKFRACFAFSKYAALSLGDVGYDTFQIVETPTNAQTILQQGGERVFSGWTGEQSAGTADQYLPNQVCGNFEFTSLTRKVLRLMYETISSGPLNDHEIQADRNASTGNRDIHVTVFPLTQQFPQAVALTDVVNDTTCTSAQEICTGSYTPTLTLGTNVTSATPTSSQFTKIGNKVIVTARGSLQATNANIASGLDISLPIASAFTSSGDGDGVITLTAANAFGSGVVYAESTNDRMQASFSVGSSAAGAYALSFSYQIK